MPTYEYECVKCEHRFEVFQSMKEPAITTCPQCGQPTVERIISAGGGLIFKGSGFYITDHRTDSYVKEAKQDKPAEPKRDAKPDTKSPDKPSVASKSAAKSTP